MLHIRRAFVLFVLLLAANALSGCAEGRLITVVDDKYPFLADESLPVAALAEQRNALRKYDQLIKSGDRVLGFDLRQLDAETAARLIADKAGDTYAVFLKSQMVCRPEFRQAVLDTRPTAVLLVLDRADFFESDLTCLADFVDLPLYLYLPPLLDDQALTFLPRLTNLRLLHAGKSRITDVGLTRLAGLENLQELHLWLSQITDESAKTINDFKKLRALNLGGAPLSDAGLASLRDLGRMRRLSLWGTRVTDAGLIHLAGMPHLQKLLLNNTVVGDGGMMYVAQLDDLRELNLWGTRVTDLGVSKLKKCANLEKLLLNETPITDRALEHLAALKNLRFLDVSGTVVSVQAKEKLKLAIPELTIRQQ